jgi:hypothetical protein
MMAMMRSSAAIKLAQACSVVLTKVVGSNPTRSISYYEGTTALNGASFWWLEDKIKSKGHLFLPNMTEERQVIIKEQALQCTS